MWNARADRRISWMVWKRMVKMKNCVGVGEYICVCFGAVGTCWQQNWIERIVD